MYAAADELDENYSWPNQKTHLSTTAQNMNLEQWESWGYKMSQRFDLWIVFNNRISGFSDSFRNTT